jgi:hypothetical protein
LIRSKIAARETHPAIGLTFARESEFFSASLEFLRRPWAIVPVSFLDIRTEGSTSLLCSLVRHTLRMELVP